VHLPAMPWPCRALLVQLLPMRSLWCLAGFFCPSSIFAGEARLLSIDLARFVYQQEVKSGWLSAPACLGGSFPLRGSLSSGEMEPLAILEASEFLLPVDAMVNGHLFQLGHSASTKHVGFDVLLKTALKNYVPSSERKSAQVAGSGGQRRGRPGGAYKD